MLKQCTKCRETKAFELFYKKLIKDGTNVGSSQCKKCIYEGYTDWRNKNKQAMVGYVMKSRLKNKDHYDAYHKEYLKEYIKRPEVKEANYERSKKWRLENTDAAYKATRKSGKRLGSGVYYILTDGGDYIGESFTMQARIYTHSCSTTQNNSIIAGNYKIISWKILEEVEPDKVLLRKREAYWISKLNPSLNTRLSS